MDSVELEKARAVANFNRYRRLAVIRQILEMFLVVTLVSWSSARAIPCFFHFSAFYFFKFNTHSVFLLGNAIIIVLFALHRLNGVVYVSCSGEFSGDCVNFESPSADEEREKEILKETRIVVYKEENRSISQCDDVEAAIRTATKRMERFRRTESEKLRREIAGKPEKKLRKSETIGGGERIDVAEIDRLSSEDFQRAVDLYIERKKKENNREKYQLVKVERLINNYDELM